METGRPPVTKVMEFTKVDLRGVKPGGAGWPGARAAVTASMAAHGFVVVAHGALDPELRTALFDRALPELYALPAETKRRNVASTAVPYQGYISDGAALESLRVWDPTDAGRVRDYGNLLWPQQQQGSNPAFFCDAIVSVSRNLVELEQTVVRMVLEGVGAREERVDEHLDREALTSYGLRLWRYGVPPDLDTGMSLLAHRDTCVTSTVVQHEVEGLEVQAGDGTWVSVPPEPDTATIIAGDFLTILTNGRIPSCLHRVRTPSNRERYSVALHCRRKDDTLVAPMDELVDGEHPVIYNPCVAGEYTTFRYSEEGRQHGDPLKAFCGVESQLHR
uniref:Uncharacterized protein n=1 Tax=Avena sativa TaxID=4498 RepID=A0ACD6AQ24_AVESA